MKTKFTKASKKDGLTVTLNLAQLDEISDVRYGTVIGDRILMELDGVPTVFIVNRERNDIALTAVTRAFPRHLRLPSVGRPVSATVALVEVIHQ